MAGPYISLNYRNHFAAVSSTIDTADEWMNEIDFYVSFNSTAVISRCWVVDNEMAVSLGNPWKPMIFIPGSMLQYAMG